MTKLAFIGAGSTIFMKNIVGDMLHFEALRDAEIALMDIDRGGWTKAGWWRRR
jgi:alpha-galactosidase